LRGPHSAVHFRNARSRSDIFCVYKYPQMRPKGVDAARLRKQKFDWLRRFQIPPETLTGSLSLTHRRCGKGNCCCLGPSKGTG